MCIFHTCSVGLMPSLPYILVSLSNGFSLSFSCEISWYGFFISFSSITELPISASLFFSSCRDKCSTIPAPMESPKTLVVVRRRSLKRNGKLALALPLVLGSMQTSCLNNLFTATWWFSNFMYIHLTFNATIPSTVIYNILGFGGTKYVNTVGNLTAISICVMSMIKGAYDRCFSEVFLYSAGLGWYLLNTESQWKCKLLLFSSWP